MINSSELIKQIKKFDKIMIFRHAFPDGDALGSQWGLYKWIKLNFPEKDVICVGENPGGSLAKIFPKSHSEDDFNTSDCLGIICDTANTERIDSDLWVDLDKVIKIDHHPNDDHYADIELANIEYSATSEIIAEIILKYKKKYEIDSEIAMFLYIGIITDTGRFLYTNTTQRTLNIAAELISYEFDRLKLFNTLYQREKEDILFGSHVQGNIKFDKQPVAYAILEKGIEEKFNLPYHSITSYVFLLKNIKNYPYQVYATYDSKDNVWKTSLRSSKKPINHIAKKYGGGGHEFAAGAKIKQRTKLLELIEEVRKLK